MNKELVVKKDASTEEALNLEKKQEGVDEPIQPTDIIVTEDKKEDLAKQFATVKEKINKKLVGKCHWCNKPVYENSNGIAKCSNDSCWRSR